MGGWSKITLWKRVMLGLALGLVVGLGLRYALGAETAGSIADTWFKPFGDAFVRLIRMLVVPLIFTTLVAGVTAMGDPKRLGGLGGRAIGLYMVTTLFAVSLGLIFGTIFQPGAGIDFSGAAAEAQGAVEQRLSAAGAADGSIAQKLLAIIPTNPVQALANQDVLAIIFFALLFGVGCLMAKDAGRPVAAALESAAEVMLKVTVMVMELAPFGVFFLMSWVMANQGLGILDNLGRMALALYIACFIQILLVYGLIIIKGLLRLPLIRFLRGIADAQAVAFSTASSAGTLPVTISNVTYNLGVKKSVAASVLPVGATINMDGTAAYLGLIGLFAAQSMGVEVTLGHYALIALTATLASIGTASVPSASLLLASTVISIFRGPDGQPLISDAQTLVIIAFIFPFDRILDMMRTLTNVSGDAAVATAVAKWEGELDEDVFRAKAVQ